jgi:hypothetical protein
MGEEEEEEDHNMSEREERLTISNSSSLSSYLTFSSTSSNPPAKAPHRSGVGQCQMSIVPWFVVEAITALLGCHCFFWRKDTECEHGAAMGIDRANVRERGPRALARHLTSW